MLDQQMSMPMDDMQDTQDTQTAVIPAGDTAVGKTVFPPTVGTVTQLPAREISKKKKSSGENLLEFLQQQFSKPSVDMDMATANYRKMLEEIGKESPSQKAQQIHQQIYGTGPTSWIKQMLNAAQNTGDPNYRGTYTPILEQQNKEYQEKTSRLAQAMQEARMQGMEHRALLTGTLSNVREILRQEGAGERADVRAQVQRDANAIRDRHYTNTDEEARARTEVMRKAGLRDPFTAALYASGGFNEDKSGFADPKKFYDELQAFEKAVRLSRPEAKATPADINIKGIPDMARRVREDPSYMDKSVPAALIPAVQNEYEKQYPEMAGHAPAPLGNVEMTKLYDNSHNSLRHAAWVKELMADPVVLKRIGPWNGRLGQFEQRAGGSATKLTPEEEMKTQEFRSALSYFFLRELRAAAVGRPNQNVIDLAKQATPKPEMIRTFMEGALNGVVGTSVNNLKTVEELYHKGRARPDFEERLWKQYPTLRQEPRIRVRLKDGSTGTLPKSSFDPEVMTEIK